MRDAEESATTKVIRGATAGGDGRKLRGIPAIGRGVSGAIRGTSPHGLHRISLDRPGNTTPY